MEPASLIFLLLSIMILAEGAVALFLFMKAKDFHDKAHIAEATVTSYDDATKQLKLQFKDSMNRHIEVPVSHGSIISQLIRQYVAQVDIEKIDPYEWRNAAAKLTGQKIHIRFHPDNPQIIKAANYDVKMLPIILLASTAMTIAILAVLVSQGILKSPY